MILAILWMLSNRCRSKSETGTNGNIRRPISTPLVNEEKAIKPPTCRSEARSMATAPPSDQPAAMIRCGSTFRVVDQVVVGGQRRRLASLLRGAAAAHSVADIFGNQER